MFQQVYYLLLFSSTSGRVHVIYLSLQYKSELCEIVTKILKTKFFHNIIFGIKIGSLGVGLLPTDFEGYITGNKIT